MDQYVFCLLTDIVTLFYLVPTPFASHAFHPIDGYLQSVPYHLFAFLFPLHRILYLVLFVLVNFWSIFVSVVFILLVRSTRTVHVLHYITRLPSNQPKL